MTHPVNLALHILENYWDRQVPIKPEDIAESMGIEVVLEDLCDNTSAIRQQAGKQPIIYIGTKQHSTYQRLALARALGHYVLSQGKCSKPTDLEANAFAQELLMPQGVIDYVVKNTKNPTVQYLAEQFWVPEDVMIDHLRQTGWLGQSSRRSVRRHQNQKQNTGLSTEMLAGLTVVSTIGSLALALLG